MVEGVQQGPVLVGTFFSVHYLSSPALSGLMTKLSMTPSSPDMRGGSGERRVRRPTETPTLHEGGRPGGRRAGPPI